MNILTILLVVGMAAEAFGQTTNLIPPNLFLTDDGSVFWYRHKERLISEKKIHEAEKLKESLPSDKFPEGNWGIPTNGFQLSLCFEKKAFTNDEPIIGTVLMRNVTNQPQTYARPVQIIAIKDGKVLKQKNDAGIIEITVLPMATVYPQTQHKYKLDVTHIYDLNESGIYYFKAVCQEPNVESMPVSITETNSVSLKF